MNWSTEKFGSDAMFTGVMNQGISRNRQATVVPVPDIRSGMTSESSFGTASDASCHSPRQCRYHTRSMNAFYATTVLLSTKQKFSKPKTGIKRPQNRVSLVRISLSITKVGNRREWSPTLTYHPCLIVIQMGWMGTCSTFAEIDWGEYTNTEEPPPTSECKCC